MSDRPIQDPPEPAESPATPEPRPATPDKTEPKKAPWFRRPVPIVLLVILALILAVLLPPVIADEVPVGLDEQGQQNASEGGWEEEEGNKPVTALAGLVFVEPTTLLRENDAGIRDGAYVYTTVKIDFMLPKGFVSDQLRENALERLAQRGVEVDFDSHQEQPYDDNGHDTAIDYYTGIAESDGFFLGDTKVDLFIATWRCSLLGSYAVVIGAAAQEDGDDGGLTGGVQGHEASGLTDLQEIQDDLLAHTKCEE